MKTSELTGAALDWAVAKCDGVPVYVSAHGSLDRTDVEPTAWNGWAKYSPSTDWSQGGPIIEREKISVTHSNFYEWTWIGKIVRIGEVIEEGGPTPLIAAMRCYVASKFGDEVEIPQELL